MQTMQSMQDSTLKLGKGMQDTTLMLGKGMLTATVQTTVGAGNMFVDAAHKTNKSISSLVHDAAAVALDREDDGPEAHEEPPAPLYVPSSWEKKDNMHVVSKQERDSMAQRVDEVIKTALKQSEARAHGLADMFPKQDHQTSAITGLHLTYTRALASLQFPTHRGSAEQTEMWTRENGKLLREWCSKAAQGERVTEALHISAADFLESFGGKGSLMAGLNARHQIINKHPFYNKESFGSADAFERWKLRELEMIEAQKNVLVTFTKREVVIEVLELRGRELPEEGAQDPRHSDSAPVRTDTSPGSKNGMGSKMMGGFSSMLRMSSTMTKDMVHNPLTSMAKATVAVVTAPVTITEVMTRTRGDVWCVVTFADNTHTTDRVPDVTSDEPSVRFNSSVTWQARPNEKGAVCVQVWRRRKHAMGMPGIKDKEELVGTTMHSWEEILQTAELHTPIEGWFTIEDGTYDDHGRSEGSRELMVRVQLLSKPIDGSEEHPLFDPCVDLHKVYSDFYRALNPGLSMMPPPACDWILQEMRIKCGVGESWHHLLRLAPGLDLSTPDGYSREAQLEVREGRLVALLEVLKGGRGQAAGTLSLIEEGLKHALKFLQAQVRNQLLEFPYRLALGEEEEHHEPVELQLLIEIDEAITAELLKLDPVANMGALNTQQVVVEGVMAFAHRYYGECIQEVLEKKKCEDGSVPPGHVQPVHVKKLCKRCLRVILGLHENFSRVLPPGAEQRAVEHIIDILTVDVLSLIAGYHIRGLGPHAFEEGSEEARLLQLHLKTVEIRKTLVEVMPGLHLGGLATATAPVLAAWVESTSGVLGKWMDSAVKLDSWEPAAGGTAGSWSSSLVDVFSSAEGAVRTFAQMRMGAVLSVRKAFLEMIGQVCTRYLKSLQDVAKVEHLQRQQEAERLAAASKKGAMGAMLGLMNFQNLGDLNFMKGVNWKERAEKAKVNLNQERLDDKDRHEEEQVSWVEKTVEKSEGYLEKMEQLADDVTSVSAWKKGFKALGSKSLALTKTVTKKTVQVSTFGMVGGEDKAHAHHDAGGSPVAKDKSQSAVKDKLNKPPKALTSRDFFDGSALVSPKACTRMCDGVQVKLQLNNMISLLEEDEGWTGGEGMAAVQGEATEDWTLSPQMMRIYEQVRAGTDEVIDMELRPLLQWLAATIGAALTDMGGTAPDMSKDVKSVFEDLRWRPRTGDSVVRGPHWNCGSQDGSYDGSKVEGVVTEVMESGWCKVRWSDHPYSYRCGADGCYDVQPASLKLPESGVPPAVAAIEEALDATLQVLRERLTDTGFNLCLKVVWVACVSVLEACLRDDMTGNIVTVKRAQELLVRLRGYMHADGDGLKESVLDDTSLALTKTMEASLL